MSPVRTWLMAAVAVALIAPAAFAQSDIGPRTTVSFAGGAGSSDSTTGVAIGGSLLFDLNERVSLEAQGSYLDRGAGTDAVSVNGSLLLNLVPRREGTVPYAAVGGGLYRASFDLANPRFLGPVGMPFGPGSTVCPAPGTGVGPGPGPGFGPNAGTCPATVAGYWGVGQMPRFYARRLGPLTVPLGGAWETHSFTDPAVNIGGGLRFHVNEDLTIDRTSARSSCSPMGIRGRWPSTSSTSGIDSEREARNRWLT